MAKPVTIVGKKSMFTYEPSVDRYGRISHFVTIAKAIGEIKTEDGRILPKFRGEDGKLGDSTTVKLDDQEFYALLHVLEAASENNYEKVIARLELAKSHFRSKTKENTEVSLYRPSGSIQINLLQGDTPAVLFAVNKDGNYYGFAFKLGIPALTAYKMLDASSSAALQFVTVENLNYWRDKGLAASSKKETSAPSKMETSPAGKGGDRKVIDDILEYM